MPSPNRKEYDRERYLRQRDVWLARTRVRHSTKRNAVRALILEYKLAHPCVDCGEADPIVLDFDHVGEKAFGITSAITTLKTVDKVAAEIAKCEVRCANCHRRKTYERRCLRPAGECHG